MRCGVSWYATSAFDFLPVAKASSVLAEPATPAAAPAMVRKSRRRDISSNGSCMIAFSNRRKVATKTDRDRDSGRLLPKRDTLHAADHASVGVEHDDGLFARTQVPGERGQLHLILHGDRPGEALGVIALLRPAPFLGGIADPQRRDFAGVTPPNQAKAAPVQARSTATPRQTRRCVSRPSSDIGLSAISR